MNHDDETILPGDGRLVRAAAVLLDSPQPFDERERDVWNEASAVGFQFFLWTIPALTSVALWLLGRPALPYVSGALALWVAAAVLTLTYAQQLGVDATERVPFRNRRGRAYGLLLLVTAGGLVRALLPVVSDPTIPSFLRGFAQGSLVGLPLGLLGAAVGLWIDDRRGADT